MSWVDILGYCASAAVLATFCMSTMIPLRIIALASNILFCAYGYFDHLYPVLALHLILFPVNLYRLLQFYRLIRDVRHAGKGEFSIHGLLPYMTARNLAAGEVLVRRGDKADRLYYLSEGELEIAELRKELAPGALIGEIGVFAHNQLRTATVVCKTACKVYELSEWQAKHLFFQDPAFGFSIMQLIITRLLENSGQRQEILMPGQTA